MAQRGYPGIHAVMPTAQRLRSALVVYGASKIKSQSQSEAVWLFRLNLNPLVGAKLAREATWQPTCLFRLSPINCGSEPARDGVRSAALMLVDTSQSRAGS
ncbi:hypothetical protein, partial [Pseudomonas corrugata]|uniref:hypothetical protein n=1 Tax=Pseudomonas corrugata TaxID=47879 RepID=UPI00128E9C46